MRILGIDPGYERLGVAIVERPEDGSRKETVVFSDCIRTNAKLSMPERLSILGNALDAVIREYKPDAAAIEELYFAKNTTTALLVAEARGVIQYVIQSSGIPCHAYHPNVIKIAVTGHGGATKQDIALMIPRLVSYDAAKKMDDELDAIAVALTHLAHSRSSYPH